MHWSAYEIFSVLTGVTCVIVGVFPGVPAKDRLWGFAGGVVFIGYGLYVAGQDSGTYFFPIWIFVVPFAGIAFAIIRLVVGQSGGDGEDAASKSARPTARTSVTAPATAPRAVAVQPRPNPVLPAAPTTGASPAFRVVPVASDWAGTCDALDLRWGARFSLIPPQGEAVLARWSCDVVICGIAPRLDGTAPAGAPSHPTKYVEAFSGDGLVILTTRRLVGMVMRGVALATPVDVEEGQVLAFSLPLSGVETVSLHRVPENGAMDDAGIDVFTHSGSLLFADLAQRIAEDDTIDTESVRIGMDLILGAAAAAARPKASPGASAARNPGGDSQDLERSGVRVPPAQPVCPSCAKALKPGARFCSACGVQVPLAGSVCSACGRKVLAAAKYCEYCGALAAAPT